MSLIHVVATKLEKLDWWRLKVKAAEQGQTVSAYLRNLILQAIGR